MSKGKRRETPPKNQAGAHEQFTKYYKLQGILEEGEWENFWDVLQKQLLVTFRVVNTPHTDWIRNTLETKFKDEIKRIDWYPTQLAYTCKHTNDELRHSDKPELRELRQFLIQHVDEGTIIRQELCSMLPVMYLIENEDITQFKAILDICSAPGSKTSQLLEIGNSTDLVIIANDNDSKRCHMLCHRLKYMSSNLIVTNHDGALFPKMRIEDPEINENSDPSESSYLEFDGVICDVPCSGDGTIHKCSLILDRWNVFQTTQFHKLQMKILKRALTLTRIGGKVVYSTCTFNPFENEAVVAAILRKAEGAVHLVQPNKMYVNYKPGLQTWKVEECFDNDQSVVDKVACASMFPPTEKHIQDQLVACCQRYYPHLGSNSGGFFIVVLTKTGPMPWDSKIVPQQQQQAQAPLKMQEDYCFVDDLEAGISEIHQMALTRFGFNLRFFDQKYNLIFRKDSKANRPTKLHIVTPSVVRCLRSKSKSPLKIISAGMIWSEGSPNKCSVESDGTVSPSVDFRVAFRATFKMIREFGHPNLLPEGPHVMYVSVDSALCILQALRFKPAEVGIEEPNKLSDISQSTFLFVVVDAQQDYICSFSVWRGRHSCDILLRECDRIFVSEILKFCKESHF